MWANRWKRMDCTKPLVVAVTLPVTLRLKSSLFQNILRDSRALHNNWSFKLTDIIDALKAVGLDRATFIFVHVRLSHQTAF